MSLWKNLIRLFYKYMTEVILYIEDGKIKGYIPRWHFTEELSDIETINTQLISFVTNLGNINQALAYLEKYGFEHENKKVLPVVNKKFDFVGLWGHLDIIKSWENIPVINKWSFELNSKTDSISTPSSHEPIKNKTNETSSASQKLAMLAMETLPIGMLALDTAGNQLLYNEDWLFLKKKYPRELRTKYILRCSKDIMAEEAHKKDIDFNKIFILNKIIANDIIKMKLIHDNHSTIGYLFWHPGVLVDNPSDSSESSGYEGKSLKEILAEKEKQILKWAMEKAHGKIIDAAKILGVPRQTFGYRYNKYWKK